MKPENNNKIRNSEMSQNDIDLINELDYEDKKKNKSYDPYERNWDEA